MITGIAFSKDRAMQLRLLLESLQKNFIDLGDTHVLYSYSNDRFKNGYEKLKSEFPRVVFHTQSDDFYSDILDIVSLSNNYVSFFTDDDIIYRPVPTFVHVLDNVFGSSQVSCFSLRLGYNTTIRESEGVSFNDSMPTQVFELEVGISEILIAWNRTSLPTGGYWSYPLSVDGHIFKKEKMLGFVNEISCLHKHDCFSGEIKQRPNFFESVLQRFYFELPPMMASFTESVLVNSPNNRVQDDFKNVSGSVFSFAQEDLNEKYLEGYIIDLVNIDFSNIKCPHQELNLSIKKYEE